jgi:hypothetical protein
MGCLAFDRCGFGEGEVFAVFPVAFFLGCHAPLTYHFSAYAESEMVDVVNESAAQGCVFACTVLKSFGLNFF